MWTDTRLSWDPDDYDGLQYVNFWVDPTPTSSSSEIWIPDVQPYNALEGIVHTLEPAYAQVQSTGAIFLSRPGALDVMRRCGFEETERHR